ncbi:MAG TPA: hypothetical protein VHJ82_07825 [Actinomycetota bacterium]|nr:hypothetical protein [Actinomycetota bacterium]
MFSCDYNGWADVPEEEREAIDVFEAAHQPSARQLYPTLVLQPALLEAPLTPERRAA